jgi:hypothetical protein
VTGSSAHHPHPGFGAFAKVHREFHDVLGDTGWTPVAGYGGVSEKVLSGALDQQRRTGLLTRLSRWQPGAAVDRPVSHAWCEEVFIIDGALMIGTPSREGEARRLPVGTYACRPPGIEHGPFFSVDGCTMIELMYYPPPPASG